MSAYFQHCTPFIFMLKSN
uniref:Uncharacterized protein n=1 Tax=Anguilla anguilla TaxID=7936 RepID=A0A0E9QE88_ANGAN